MYLRMLGASIAAIIIVLLATPHIKRLAFRIGAVDEPNSRRINKVPIANIGGIAIFLGFWIAVFLFGELSTEVLWIFFASSIIMFAGFFDDILDLSPFLKLFIQVGAALMIVVFGGVRIDFFRFPMTNNYINLGVLAVPVSVLWIVGITNAINFIDGLDGLAAGTAGIAATTLVIVAFQQGYLAIALMLIALASSCFAFLKYNANPAKIFMGDTGAMTLGFLLAALSVEGLMKSATTIAIFVPFLALGLPIFDSTFSIARRLLNGKSPFYADRGHLHHRLLDRGFDQKKAVRILYTASMLSGGIAIIFVTGINIFSVSLFVAILGFAMITFSQIRALQKQNK
jgi:UDP-GlcNAc:undecaprenyl-phosphate GlcNAc-1-phosphate transferase